MYIQFLEDISYDNCSHFWENVRFCFLENYFKIMFSYTVKYTDSESDIQNTNSLYKTHQQCQNTFF